MVRKTIGLLVMIVLIVFSVRFVTGCGGGGSSDIIPTTQPFVSTSTISSTTVTVATTVTSTTRLTTTTTLPPGYVIHGQVRFASTSDGVSGVPIGCKVNDTLPTTEMWTTTDTAGNYPFAGLSSPQNII